MATIPLLDAERQDAVASVCPPGTRGSSLGSSGSKEAVEGRGRVRCQAHYYRWFKYIF